MESQISMILASPRLGWGSRLKVLTVVTDPRIGGVQKRISFLARCLRENGMQVETVLPKGSKTGRGVLESSGVPTVAFSYGLLIPTKLDLSIRDMLLWIPQSIMFPLYLARHIKTLAPEIVHVNGLLGLRAVITAKVGGKKVIWHLIGGGYPRIAIWIWRKMLRGLADINVFVSHTTMKFYTGSDRTMGNEMIIEEPVDVNYLSRKETSPEELLAVRKDLGIAKDERMILFVGNLNRNKGVEILLKAFHEVIRNRDSLKLVIMGESVSTQLGYQDQLDRTVRQLHLESRVAFVGNYENLRGLLGNAAVFALPSFAEGTPLAILEAMSMELPIVATRVGGIPEILRNGIEGIVVPPGNPDAFAEALIAILDNPLKGNAMGQRGRETAVTRFSLADCCSKHVSIYRTLAVGRSTQDEQ